MLAALLVGTLIVLFAAGYRALAWIRFGFGLRAHELRHRDGCTVACRRDVEHAREQVALRADRVVDRLHRDAGFAGDAADRRRVIAPLEEELGRGRDDRPLGLLRSDLLPRLDGSHLISISFQSLEPRSKEWE